MQLRPDDQLSATRLATRVITISAMLLFAAGGCDHYDETAWQADRLIRAVPLHALSLKQPPLIPLPQAATLLDAIRVRPRDATLRDRLSDVYATAGYSVMSKFFRASKAVAENRPFVWRQRSRHDWACGADDQQDFDRSEVWLEGLRHGRFDDVSDETQKFYEQHPASCLTGLMHAQAVLLQSEVRLSSTTAVDRELAVRTWLTYLDEANLLPLGHPDPPAVYITLAQYFSTVGDERSASTAYRIARLRLGESVTARDVLAEDIERHLVRLNRLKQ